MKKLILSVGVFVLGSIIPAAVAQEPAKSGLPLLGRIVEQQVLQAQKDKLKSYYRDRETANLCEEWYSCAKWAFEQYVNDQTFVILRAKRTTQRVRYRHWTRRETRLYVQASIRNRIFNVMFTTPRGSGRIQSYRYVTDFPKDSPKRK